MAEPRSGLLCVAALLALLPATVAADPDADAVELARAVATAEPVGEGIAPASYAAGGLTLELTAGRAYALRADERLVGAYLTGSGRYEYHNREPLAARNFAANVRRSTRSTVEDNRLTGSFEEAWILDGRIADRHGAGG